MKKIELKYQIPSGIIIFLVLFLVWKIGLPYFQNARLEYAIDKVISYDRNVSNTPPDEWEVKDQIFFKAKQLGLPLKKMDININRLEHDLEVSIKYKYTVDLVLKKITLEFKSIHRSGI